MAIAFISSGECWRQWCL